ncbi:sensor histidine kinase [Nocardiopsis sp. JB363]|uniref:sensor histidine kinase n=1 Tax=Nocardiopsis sp. JB363 TaxID=1434837 RepID=UPI00097A1231|nr:histidine kinase [Nocardiopsis sp. JB363]SIO90019.1 sensor histidine kinase [Nocardiopsis sp. JB363]
MGLQGGTGTGSVRRADDVRDVGSAPAPAGADEEPTDAFETADGGRYTRRQRRLRWVVLFFMSALGLLFLVWPGYELLFHLDPTGRRVEHWIGEGQQWWPTLVALGLGAIGTAFGWRMTWERVNGRADADPRLYWGTLVVVALMCVFLQVPFYIFSACAGAWCLLVFMAPWRQALRISPLLVVLPWTRVLLDPLDHAPLLLGADFVLALVFMLFLWSGCVATFWMWDATREAVEGSQARARLAVNEERLRFADDIRDLLGTELSTLAVSADHAGRVLRTDPGEARRRIDRVHEAARGTLQRVRSVVRGYRDLDLETEVGSVRAVLEQNRTVTTVTGLGGLDLPRETAGLAAWVVREGGTNVLRHSDARRCRIGFSMEEAAEDAPGNLVIEMANDGAELGEVEDTGSASGLSGLAERVERVGGTLTASSTADGGFRLRTVVPLSADSPLSGESVQGPGAASLRSAHSPPVRPSDGSPAAGPSATGGRADGVASPHDARGGTTTEQERWADRRFRITRLINFVMLGGSCLFMVVFPLFDLVFAAADQWPLWRSAVGAGLCVPNVVLLILLMRNRIDGDRAPSPKLYWTSLALLVAAVVLLASPVTTLFTIALWWSIGALLAPRRTTLIVSAVLFVSPLPLLPTYAVPITDFPLYVLVWAGAIVVALAMVTTTMITILLWDASREAVIGQRARARLAVTEERLRFARDMHDLLGHSLSALAVKAQLASRLVDRAPERAAVELAEVQDLARQALGQVRSAVSGHREADLADEVASVTSILETGGTRTTVTGLEALELPARVEATAAWVVREGATNVLRHSDAEECQITFTLARGEAGENDTLVLEMHNDHARERVRDENGGNGLTGLAERVSASGGTISGSGTRDGGFLLRAVLPL